MIVSAGQATSYSIVISPPGVDRSFLHCPGANDTFDAAADVPAGAYVGARLFHFGYPPLMRRLYTDGGRSLRELFDRVRASGETAVSLDLARPDPASDSGRVDWPAWLAQVLPAVDLFCPSVDELLYMLDRPAFDRFSAGEPFGDVVTAARLRGLEDAMLDLGAAACLVKLGEQGLHLRTSEGARRIADFAGRLGIDAVAWRGVERHTPCFRANVVGTTGAGDSTIAGFLAALLRREGPVTAARAACAVGAASVESASATAGIPHWHALERRLAGGWPQHATRLDGMSSGATI
jgi:sugar/nucleoside kinase (ribokinase family)